MEIPFSRWYAAIAERRSRRRFDSRPIETALAERLDSMCRKFRPFPGARAVLVNQPPDRIFKGAVGHYGSIKGAPAFIAFIGESGDPHVNEKVGYTGEGIILEATALGLATCWVGALFRPEQAANLTGAEKNEKVLAVSPVGWASKDQTLEERIMSGFGRNHRRRPLAEMTGGLEEGGRPRWMRAALEAARLAPSAVNRQPWQFGLDEGGITVSVDSPKDSYNISRRLDCGIAMLHLEAAALDCGVPGRWRLLESPGVARFTPL
ncbi:MAG: nitroreductase [Peptococcaceae bacterium BICA1-7]|nr:MAG: nitroreductase [Peptococcaceae bacterium BICA1-7]HBV98946.1 nitroreductase [Desulfotomaculum sp.]